MLDRIKERLQLTDSQWSELGSNLKQMDVPAKTVLLREGETPSRIFFVEQGCLRIWFNNEGKDLTLQFFFENSVVASLENFKKKQPSQLTIETIEACKLWYIGREDMELLLADITQKAALNDLFIDFILERTFSYMKLFLSFIKDTPKQRYLNLVQERPEIVTRVPQHYIASYLGVSSVHLSRIKNQIAKKR